MPGDYVVAQTYLQTNNLRELCRKQKLQVKCMSIEKYCVMRSTNKHQLHIDEASLIDYLSLACMITPAVTQLYLYGDTS